MQRFALFLLGTAFRQGLAFCPLTHLKVNPFYNRLADYFQAGHSDETLASLPKIVVMDKTQRAALKEKIEAALQKTKTEVAQLEEATKPIAPENAIGRVSRMDAINNKGVSEAALRSAKRKLTNLEIALGKIDAEDFGICEQCKRPIRPARLMYMPESTRCVRCADR